MRVARVDGQRFAHSNLLPLRPMGNRAYGRQV